MRTALLIWLALTGSLLADGGSVLFQERQGKYEVTVFGLPSPLRAGPVDLSVMVQEVATREPVLDAKVGLSVKPLFDASGAREVWTPPCCSMKRSDDSYAATRERAQNKLMYHALIPITAEGEWELTVEMRHRNDAHYFVKPLAVAAPRRPMLTYWPLLVLPFVTVGGFALNRYLRSR